MQEFKELTDEKKAQLSDEEIDEYIRQELMTRGVVS